MSFVRVVDMETTDKEPTTSDVIEVGWIDVAADGTIGKPHQIFSKPTRPIEFEAMAAHHLTEADVARGVSSAEWQALLTEGGPVAFVAHNSKFEAALWPTAPAPWICTYKSALRLWPESPRHSNQVLRYWLHLDQDEGWNNALAMPPHRAAPDAYVTAHIFARMLQEEGENRLKRLLRWSREPGLLPKVTFGKHAKAKWTDVPADYLEWIGRQKDMEEDVRFTASMELQRRKA
jgi:exodeoxyribonuclease X